MKGIKRLNPKGKKFCSICEKTLLFKYFPKASASHDGHFTYCKKCLKIKNKGRTYELRRKWHLAKYGLTPEKYQEILDGQGGGCAICGDFSGNFTTNKNRKTFAVDHCHDTGAIRGLLCARCNQILGTFDDRTKFLFNAIRYLSRKRIEKLNYGYIKK